MYRIMIVDDEPGISEGMKRLIERENPEWKVEIIAYNGNHGYELARQFLPDIIITDICMPQSDGLEMIRRLHEGGSRVEFVLISGYSEFEYARKAMTYGVQHYILKPVEEEELFRALEDVCRSIDRRRSHLQKVKSLEDTAKTNMKAMQALLLRDLINTESEDSAKMMLDACEFPTDAEQYVCALLDTGNNAVEASVVADQLVPDKTAYSIAVPYGRNQYVIILSNPQASLVISLRQLLINLKEAVGGEFSMGLGLPVRAADKLNYSFRQAQTALSYKLLWGTGSVIAYRDLESIGKKGSLPSKEDMNRLEILIGRMNIPGSSAAITDIFEKIKNNRQMSLESLQMLCMNIILHGTRRLPADELNKFIPEDILSLEGIARFSSLELLRDRMISAIHEILRRQADKKQKVPKHVVSELTDYLNENYHKEISLVDLSGRFFLSPQYLSQMFKEKTGDTYLNYLMGLRIDAAKKLLAQSDLKVYEICERVGYTDTTYFSRLFEKKAGCKPTEYRKRNRK